MEIIINIDEILFDIRNKSHEECSAAIADAEARFRAEAGNHKNEELYRSLRSVHAALQRRVVRFLRNSHEKTGANDMYIPTSFVYEFEMSERRAQGKVQALADAMHDYLVHYTLAKFYATVTQGELSNKHSLLTGECEAEIMAILYDKMPPINTARR